jgi:hypothetical protein
MKRCPSSLLGDLLNDPFVGWLEGHRDALRRPMFR